MIKFITCLILCPLFALANYPNDRGINDSKFFPAYGGLPPINKPVTKSGGANDGRQQTDQKMINDLNNRQINQLEQACKGLTVMQCAKNKPDVVKGIMGNAKQQPTNR